MAGFLERWRDRIFGISQTDARERLKAAMDGLPGPRATVDQHGQPREGWDKSDGRERMDARRSRWQGAADRILRKRRTA